MYLAKKNGARGGWDGVGWEGAGEALTRLSRCRLPGRSIRVGDRQTPSVGPCHDECIMRRNQALARGELQGNVKLGPNLSPPSRVEWR